MDHGATGDGKSGTHSDAPNKNLSSLPSSSSVASSLYEDPVELEPRKSNVDASLPPKQGTDAQSPSPARCEDGTPAMQCADTATMQSPSRQNMDRVDNEPAASPSAYRIPDYVFARNISTAPYEWSVASNESLFSIHPGNMSFTGDQLSYKSGELGLPGEYAIPGSPADFKNNRPPTPTNKSMELSTPKSETSHIGATEAAAAEMMREVIRETEEDPRKVKPAQVPVKELPPAAAPIPSLGSHRSEDSMGSVKSFAFPVLPGVDKSTSSRPGSKSKQAAPVSPETPKESPSAPPTQQNPESEEAALKDSKEAPPANPPKKWCPCLPCCPF
ncbi:hypothetical protein ACFE04_009189 [Oxalis oulophora]